MIYRPEIDGLRAVAVLAVMVYHFFPANLPNGGLGVDIFFVISGFVITASIYHRQRTALKDFLVTFFTRRIKRLMPALVGMIVITSLLLPLVDPFPEQSIYAAVAAIFGLSNNYLYIVEQDYFGPTAELNPFTHTWSLGVEEQFYVLFPFIVWFGWRFNGWRGVAIVLGALALLSLVAWGMVFDEDPLAAFYLVIFRFWQIAAGALTFLLQLRFSGKPDIKGAVYLKQLVTVAIAVALFLPVIIDRQWATVFSVVATCAVLYWIRDDSAQMWALHARLSRYFGKISYSLYLWHWPVVVFLSWTVGTHMGISMLGIIASIFMAHLSWVYLEKPLRHAKWPSISKDELSTGIAVIVIAAGGLHFYNAVAREALFGQQLELDASLGRSSLFLPYISDNGTVWAGRDCALVDNADIGKIIEVERCRVGHTHDDKKSQVLIIGNSFAPAFVAAFDIQQGDNNIATSFILAPKFGGSPVPDIDWRSHSKRATVDYWERVIPDLFQKLKPGDHVLIISDLAKLSPRKQSDWAVGARESLRVGLIQLSAKLAEREIGLSILGPLPFLRETRCTPQMALRQWRSAELSLCRYYTREATIKRFEPVTSLLQSLENDKVLRVLNLFDVFCPDNTCEYADKDGALLYRDVYSHASLLAARRSRPLVAQWLNDIREKIY
jgi:peptidoglycan/LPS O-acetylase OafA/YrhL